MGEVCHGNRIDLQTVRNSLQNTALDSIHFLESEEWRTRGAGSDGFESEAVFGQDLHALLVLQNEPIQTFVTVEFIYVIETVVDSLILGNSNAVVSLQILVGHTLLAVVLAGVKSTSFDSSGILQTISSVRTGVKSELAL